MARKHKSAKQRRHEQRMQQQREQNQQQREENQESETASSEADELRAAPSGKTTSDTQKQKGLPISSGGFGLGLVTLGWVWPFLWGVNVAAFFSAKGRSPSMMSDVSLGFCAAPVFFLVGGILSMMGWSTGEGRVPGIVGTILSLPFFLILVVTFFGLISRG